MAPELPLHISFTPDPDDAFAWWAIATGRVAIPGHHAEIAPLPLQQANMACVNQRLHVAAISAAAYPFIWRNYAILDVGASIGRGYGPALVTRCENTHRPLPARIAVPGGTTTGALMLRLFFPKVETVEMRCDEVAPAIAEGLVEAGVLIHEELLNWEHKGLRRVMCLGNEWHRRTGLPLPVGLIVAHRALGASAIGSIAAALQESIHLAADHRAEALDWAMHYSHQASGGIGEKFIDMFTNSDSLALPPDCRTALAELYSQAFAAALIPELPPINTFRPDPARYSEVA